MRIMIAQSVRGPGVGASGASCRWAGLALLLHRVFARVHVLFALSRPEKELAPVLFPVNQSGIY